MKFFFILLFLVSCASSYDVSKGIEVLPSNEIVPEYSLSQVQLKVENSNDVVEVTDFKKEKLARVGFGAFEFNSKNLFVASNKKLKIISLQTLEVSELPHGILKPEIALFEDYILVYNIVGVFELFSINGDFLWKGEVGAISSKFVCNGGLCYAMNLEGEVVIVDVKSEKVEKIKVSQRHEMYLLPLYKPAFVNEKLAFAGDDSNFLIFDLKQKKPLGQSSFVGEEATVFDINLVRQMHHNSRHLIISYIGGSYAMDLEYLRPLWLKKYNFFNATIFENFAVFKDENTQKLMLVFIETGDVKWLVDFPKNPVTIKVEYNGNLLVFEKNGLHVLDSQTGEEIHFVKGSFDFEKHFVLNGVLYFIRGGNLYKMK